MDNELLKRVLRENSRIIIPGFGAFLRKEQGGAMIFSPFLRTDDGKLSAIVALEYGISPTEAATMISEFSEKVRTILKVKSKYYIDEVGMLMVDSNGVVSFVEEIAKPTPVAQTTPAPEPYVAPQPTRPVQPLQPQPIQQHTATPRPMMPTPPPQPIPQPMPARAQPLAAPAAPVAPAPSPFARAAAPQPVSGTPRPTPQKPQQPVAGRAPSQMPPKGTGQPKRTGAVRPIKKSKKSDMWLMIAILAAAVVILLMVYAIAFAPKPELPII